MDQVISLMMARKLSVTNHAVPMVRGVEIPYIIAGNKDMLVFTKITDVALDIRVVDAVINTFHGPVDVDCRQQAEIFNLFFKFQIFHRHIWI